MGIETAEKNCEDSDDRGGGNTSNQGDIRARHTYKNAREYAQALRPWLNWYHQTNAFQQSMSMSFSSMNAANFQLQNLFHLNSCLNANNPSFSPFSASNILNNTQRSASDPYASRRPPIPGTDGLNRQQAPPNQNPADAANNIQNQQDGDANEGVRMKIPTFWKRVAAELIDFTFLFYIKMIISISLVTEFNLDYVSLISGEDIIERFNDLDYDKAFAITFEVIALEIINRVLITIFETMCLCRARARGRTAGATPGKRLMGLRVVSCDTIRPIGNGQVMVTPAGNISIKNAFLRSVIKNFTIAFFLPACLTLFFFKHNRTAYDVVAHTVVVEEVREAR